MLRAASRSVMKFFQPLIPAIEILIIASLISYLLSFFWNTRSRDLVIGTLGFLAMFVFSYYMNFPVLHRLMLYFVNVAVIAFLVIFQPELRLILSKFSVRGKKFRETTEFDHFLDSLSTTIYRLADKRIGAIVVLENHDSLTEYTNKAVPINAEFTPELLESIFTTTTPLHDGAVIIRNQKILAAATILPLAEDSSQIAKSMGTRHRAALGISQASDAIAIVVSEETGKVSIAREGIMTRGIKMDRFKGVIRSIFTQDDISSSSENHFKEWVKRWIR